MGIVSSAVGKFRTTLLIMLFCIIAGVLGRTSMPIASNPNVTFPWVNISVFLEGASPEDMARLVAKPLPIDYQKSQGVYFQNHLVFFLQIRQSSLILAAQTSVIMTRVWD